MPELDYNRLLRFHDLVVPIAVLEVIPGKIVSLGVSRERPDLTRSPARPRRSSGRRRLSRVASHVFG